MHEAIFTAAAAAAPLYDTYKEHSFIFPYINVQHCANQPFVPFSAAVIKSEFEMDALPFVVKLLLHLLHLSLRKSRLATKKGSRAQK
jgi:hypothetical protein